MATVVFHRNADSIPAPMAGIVEARIRHLLESVRPSNESWHVTHREQPNGEMWDLEFTNGPRTETLFLKGGDADAYSEAFTTAAQVFLKANWVTD